ncbi:MAG: AAA family ATPase [Clostridiales bacterium]|nr:AAA family ATPase [Clostridiales bacterium]
MKTILLQSLRLEHFKGVSALTLDFHGHSCAIYGENSTGKSSIRDAWTWLLFGKDGSGASSFEIKPVNGAGEVADHNAITSVSAVLTVDGAEKKLRRTWYEKWTTRRGNPEPVYDGNTGDFYVDDVPCKKATYQAAIKELVGTEDGFHLLTDTDAFAALDWRKRRSILFDAAHVAGDRELMGGNPHFAPLLEAMGSGDLDTLTARLNAQRRETQKKRDSIPVRLDELERSAKPLAGVDYDRLEKELTDLTQERQTASDDLAAYRAGSAESRLWAQLTAATLEKSELQRENDQYRAGQRTDAPDLPALEQAAEAARQRAAGQIAYITRLQERVAEYEASLAEAQQRWRDINRERFTGSTCPTCGQTLPPQQQEEAKQRFQADKEPRLSRAVTEGKRLSNRLTEERERLEEAKEQAQALHAQQDEAENQLARGKRAQPGAVSDLPEYRAKLAEVEARIADLTERHTAAERDSLSARQEKLADLHGIDEEIRRVQERLAGREQLETLRRRREELVAQQKTVAARMAELENLLYLADEFLRYKVERVEQSVNSLFREARFRLFREQVNGGLEPCCDITYDGVPWGSLNDGRKITLGLDIIDGLAWHYGVRAPVLLDNAEAVTGLTGYNGQLIRLTVSEQDKELRMEVSK